MTFWIEFSIRLHGDVHTRTTVVVQLDIRSSRFRTQSRIDSAVKDVVGRDELGIASGLRRIVAECVSPRGRIVLEYIRTLLRNLGRNIFLGRDISLRRMTRACASSNVCETSRWEMLVQKCVVTDRTTVPVPLRTVTVAPALATSRGMNTVNM